jgi:hypothetical protein
MKYMAGTVLQLGLARAAHGSLLALALVGLLLPQASYGQAKKPNILVIFGDDIGQANIGAYSLGLVGYKTPNIDRIAKEGMIFTDYYAENSCTAGRSSFVTGQKSPQKEIHHESLHY